MKVSTNIGIIALLLSFSCADNVIKKDSLAKNNVVLKEKNKIDLTGEVAFNHQTGEVINETSPVLPSVITFLNQHKDYNIEVVVYYINPSQKFVKDGLLESGGLKDYLIANGIEKSRVTFNTNFDKRNKYEYTSPFRKAELVLTKISL